MVEEVAKPIGWTAIYRDGRLYENTQYTSVLFKTYSSAVGAIKRSYGLHDYEKDELRIVPVFL